MTASSNNTYVQQGQVITDAAGNSWQILNGQVVVNGQVDQTTNRVLALAYENGRVWQMNADRLWWSKGAPTDAWSPTYGTTTSPLVGYSSANNSLLDIGEAAAGGVIADANNDHWSILNGQITVNGTVDQTTGRVLALVFENGTIWQENADFNWYSKVNAADTWSAPTKTSPIQLNLDQIATVIVPPAGNVTISPGQHNSDLFVFTGTAFNTLEGISFLQAPVSVISSLIVSGTPASNGNPAITLYGSVSQAGDLDVNGGIHLSQGRLDASMQPGNRLVLGGPSTIDTNGSFYVNASGSSTVQLDSSLTLGAGGSNILDLDGVNLSGGTIVQNGENDNTSVGGVPPSGIDGSVTGTDFVINGGTLDIAWPGGFGGTIGSGTGSAIGIFGEVDIQNALDVARASFDTTTGVMSLLNATGTDLGDYHFAGDASGLELNMKPGGVLAINDHPVSGQGNIQLTFHG